MAIGRSANEAYVPEISREGIIDLVADMNRGFAVLSGFWNQLRGEHLRQFVETAMAATGGKDVVFTSAIPMPIVVCAGLPVALRVGLEF